MSPIYFFDFVQHNLVASVILSSSSTSSTMLAPIWSQKLGVYRLAVLPAVVQTVHGTGLDDP